MSTYWNDLKALEDLTDKITAPIEEPYNDDDIEQFKESVQYFIDDFINHNIKLYKEKDFENTVFDAIYTMIVASYGIDIFPSDFDLDYHIYDAMEIYFYKNNAFRSYSKTTILKAANKRRIKRQLTEYNNMEQPEQRTLEWYQFRREGLSASDIYKALDTESSKNALIYKKCKPLDTTSRKTNITSACHNGHKYEPLSIMHYEYDFNTQVGEFGCKNHPKYSFLKASPDGINIKEESPLYGRLVEVKNPTTRELTGIPKKEYWIQMQLQMEVWNLDECDFLETVFKEYANEEEFYKDGDSFTRNSKDKRKGIMIMFNDGVEPIYKYPPVDISKKEFDEWYDKTLDENDNLSWIGNIYWYLHDYSCVLVPRNKKWFNAVFPEFKELWNTILKERKTGYDHRKPRKNKKKKAKNLTPNSLENLKNKTEELFTNTEVNTNIDNKGKNIVIRVRTESFSK